MTLLSNRQDFDRDAMEKIQEQWLNEIMQAAEFAPTGQGIFFKETNHEKVDGALEAARRMLAQTESGNRMRSHIAGLVVCLEMHRDKLDKDYTVEDKRRANAFENYCETHRD